MFKLIETMLLSDQVGYFLLKSHIKRMENSAKFFGFACKPKEIINKLKNIQKKLNPKQKYKVRIMLSKEGKIEADYSVIRKGLSSKIVLSKLRTNSDNRMLLHKTTNRKLYNKEYNKFSRKGFCDVIFQNEKGEVTEGAISNIFILKNGIYYTPLPSCGLLPGTFRAFFINSNIGKAKEKILYLNDLKVAEKIFICNSVRGMKQVKLET